MKIAQMRKHDIANGPGIRTTIFVSGCTHNCEDCFNKEYQDYNYGEDLSCKHIDKLHEYISDPRVTGISILGGEPMQQEKDKDMLCLIREFKLKYPHKKIWVWTGYTIEHILNTDTFRHAYNRELLKYIDVLVDGRFVKDLKDVRLKYCGSSNQRVIDVQETLKQSKVVLYDVGEVKHGYKPYYHF